MEEFHRIPILIVEDLSDKEFESFNCDHLKHKISSNLVSKARDSTDFVDPIELIKEFKEAGKKSYELGKYDLAIESFLKAKNILDIELNLKKSNIYNERSENILERIILISNCIACYLKKRDYEEAVKECRFVMQELTDKREYCIHKDQSLSILWKKIENKVKYRFSLSLLNIYKESIEKGDINQLKESFDLVKEILDYYRSELEIEPPKEILDLYNQVSNSLHDHSKDQSINQNPNLYIEVSEKSDNYLEEYIRRYNGYNQPSEYIPESPISVIERMTCNSNIDFMKIWQNISKSDQFVDYYLIYGKFFIRIDKLFNKIELESNILEKVLERILAIINEMKRLSSFNQALVIHLSNLMKKLTSTHRFGFVSLISDSCGTVDKICHSLKEFSNESKNLVTYLNQSSLNVQI